MRVVMRPQYDHIAASRLKELRALQRLLAALAEAARGG